jgi:hypothetical protein
LAQQTTITVNQTDLLDYPEEEDPDFCEVKFQPSSEYEFRSDSVSGGYSNQPTFVLGSVFYQQICLSYHYGLNQLGVGIPK